MRGCSNHPRKASTKPDTWIINPCGLVAGLRSCLLFEVGFSIWCIEANMNDVAGSLLKLLRLALFCAVAFGGSLNFAVADQAQCKEETVWQADGRGFVKVKNCSISCKGGSRSQSCNAADSCSCECQPNGLPVCRCNPGAKIDYEEAKIKAEDATAGRPVIVAK